MTQNYQNHELKFTVSNNRVHSVIKWLDTFCISDSKFPIGKVSSIYYDTKNWKFLNEKINSDYLKTKIRIRWYYDILNGRYYDQSFIEAKFKIGNQRKKVRLETKLTGKDLSELQLNDLQLLRLPFLLYEDGVIVEEKIYPAFQIRYTRMRYIEPYTRSRICFDYNISAPRVNSFMMTVNTPFTLNTAVFEIKGKENVLPFSLYPLTAMGCKKSSFSKYSMCYDKITEYK